jgi:hypothetical protein
LCLAGIGKRVAHEVHAATLPSGTQNLDDGGLQTLMRVRDPELKKGATVFSVKRRVAAMVVDLAE